VPPDVVPVGDGAWLGVDTRDRGLLSSDGLGAGLAAAGAEGVSFGNRLFAELALGRGLKLLDQVLSTHMAEFHVECFQLNGLADRAAHGTPASVSFLSHVLTLLGRVSWAFLAKASDLPRFLGKFFFEFITK